MSQKQPEHLTYSEGNYDIHQKTAKPLNKREFRRLSIYTFFVFILLYSLLTIPEFLPLRPVWHESVKLPVLTNLY